jgi:phosphohistidine phosphatase
MKILLLRHAIAQDQQTWAAQSKNDDLRPLTKTGSKRMRRQVRGLARIVANIDFILTSPLVRAKDTAELVHGEFPQAAMRETKQLAPGSSPLQLIEVLGAYRPDTTVALVGHEPALSLLLDLLLTGQLRGTIRLKKGGACLVEFSDLPTKGVGTLRWLASPALLRALGACS